MTSHDSLSKYTQAVVKNLPFSVDEEFVSEYFRSEMGISECEVTPLFLPRPKAANMDTIIDFGSYAKVQQAIRDMTGKIIDDKRITVALHVPSFSQTPGNLVDLSNIPQHATFADIYDILSRFGTIVDTHIVYQSDESQSLRHVGVVFLEVEDAQSAIRVITSNRVNDDSIIAAPDKAYVAPDDAENQRRQSKEAKKTTKTKEGEDVSKNEGDARTKDEDINTPPSGPAVETFSPSTNTKTVTSVSVSTITDDEGVHERAKTVKRGDSPTSVPLEVPTLNLASIESEEGKRRIVRGELLGLYRGDIKPAKRLERVLQVLEKSLKPEHMLEHCKKREGFALYRTMAESALRKGQRIIPQLSTKVLEIAEEIELAYKSSEEQLKAIREYLYYQGAGLYPHEALETILDKLVSNLEALELLELCSEDEEAFRMFAFCAKAATYWDTDLTLPPHSSLVKQLALQLELDTLGSKGEWAYKLREYLLTLYKDYFVDGQLATTVHNMLLHVTSLSDFFNFIAVCAVDVHRFCVYAAVASTTSTLGDGFVFRDIPHSVVAFVEGLNLSKPISTDVWKDSILKHWMHIYGDRYDRETFVTILDWQFDTTASSGSLYHFLEICAGNERQFSAFITLALMIDQRQWHRLINDFSDPMVEMVHHLGFDKLGGEGEKVAAVNEYLSRLHNDYCGENMSLQAFTKIQETTKESTRRYDLIKLCTVDKHRYSVYLTVAEQAALSSEPFEYQDLPNDVVDLVLQLGLDKLDIIRHKKEAMKRHLTWKYGTQYEAERLEGVLNNIFLSPGPPSRYYDLLKLCTVDEYRFSVYAAVGELAEVVGESFYFREIPDSTIVMVRRLGLHKSESITEWQSEVRSHVASLCGRVYDRRKITDFVDSIAYDLSSYNSFYSNLDLCMNRWKLYNRLYACS